MSAASPSTSPHLGGANRPFTSPLSSQSAPPSHLHPAIVPPPIRSGTGAGGSSAPPPPRQLVSPASMTSGLTSLGPLPSSTDTRTQLYVGNLPFRVRWQDLKDLMRKCGPVLRADVALTPIDGRSRGFGVVLFARQEDAWTAIEKYNGYNWQTRVLDVRLDTQDPTGALAIAEANRQQQWQQQQQPPNGGLGAGPPGPGPAQGWMQSQPPFGMVTGGGPPPPPPPPLMRPGMPTQMPMPPMGYGMMGSGIGGVMVGAGPPPLGRNTNGIPPQPPQMAVPMARTSSGHAAPNTQSSETESRAQPSPEQLLDTPATPIPVEESVKEDSSAKESEKVKPKVGLGVVEVCQLGWADDESDTEDAAPPSTSTPLPPRVTVPDRSLPAVSPPLPSGVSSSPELVLSLSTTSEASTAATSPLSPGKSDREAARTPNSNHTDDSHVIKGESSTPQPAPALLPFPLHPHTQQQHNSPRPPSQPHPSQQQHSQQQPFMATFHNQQPAPAGNFGGGAMGGPVGFGGGMGGGGYLYQGPGPGAFNGGGFLGYGGMSNGGGGGGSGFLPFYPPQQQQQQQRGGRPDPRHEAPPGYNNRHLFVGNLPFNCQWQELKDLMRSAGSVLRADIAQGPDGRSRGFGSVLFSTSQDAERAVAMFNGYDYSGRALKVHFDKFAHQTPGNPMPYPPVHTNHPPQPPYPYQSLSNIAPPPSAFPPARPPSPPRPLSSSASSTASTVPVSDSPKPHLTPPGRIAIPPPTPYAGFGGPLMTPSMPAFTLGAFPATPPLYPQFFSPGLGPFSPPMRGENYFVGIGRGGGGYDGFVAAPGAPLHREEVASPAKSTDSSTPPAKAPVQSEPSYFPPVPTSASSNSSPSPSPSPSYSPSSGVPTSGLSQMALSPGWGSRRRSAVDEDISVRRRFEGGGASERRASFEGERRELPAFGSSIWATNGSALD